MNDCKPEIKLSILLTGNELLEGSILDTNSTFLSVELLQQGVRTTEKRVVGDAPDQLKKALIELSEQNDVLIVNGGLGATVDDLTAEVVSELCQKKLVKNQKAYEHLTENMKKRIGKPTLSLPDYLERQALLPEGCETIDNPVGAALGFKIELNHCVCYFTPGVPSELKAMFSASILPDILHCFQRSPIPFIEKRMIQGIGEYRVQSILFKLLSERERADLNIGFRAVSPFVELKITPASSSVDMRTVMAKVDHCFKNYCLVHGSTPEEDLYHILKQKGKTVVTAESCTGGLIASRITQVPGISNFFLGGWVTYSNQLKQTQLKVPENLLREKGAVSAEVAEAMVKGALSMSNADYAVAVTGIAGPAGGDKDKPVGTVYIGVGSHKTMFTRKLLIRRERKVFQRLTASVALDLLRKAILGGNLDGYYYFDQYSEEKALPQV